MSVFRYLYADRGFYHYFVSHMLMPNIRRLRRREVDKLKTPNAIIKVKNPTHDENEVSVFHLLITVLQFSQCALSQLGAFHYRIMLTF